MREPHLNVPSGAITHLRLGHPCIFVGLTVEGVDAFGQKVGFPSG
jgi:hypothetical protein